MSDDHHYRNLDHLRFVEDMEEAGLDVRHYRGRVYWTGPAVVVDDLQDALSATRVRCQWDNMSLGWVVYPRAYDHDADPTIDSEASFREGCHRPSGATEPWIR